METLELHKRGIDEIVSPVQLYPNRQGVQGRSNYKVPGRIGLFRQILRFVLVGGLNTVVDLLILNALLLLFPTSSTSKLLVYSSLAYSIGSVNSFLLNKYWTFGQRQRTTRKELVRFVLTTLCGMVWSSIILWLASDLLHPFLVNATVWANVSKVLAIGGTAFISYLGMRLWVFVSKGQQEQTLSHAAISVSNEHQSTSIAPERDAQTKINESCMVGATLAAALPAGITQAPINSHSLSVVLPAYNEEQVIAGTVSDILDVLSRWRMDFEVLVVNDGSTDSTAAIVGTIADMHPQVRLVTHSTNQGYGAALVSGFTAATKELTFFMDADGQFDIRDLHQFFPFIDEYDAVIGYRIDRQDSWMRKLNAWGWKLLIAGVLDVHVRDIDCAFKLLHTEFLQQHPLETRGAMINAELLYKLTRAGYCYREIGVHHHPRKGGRATGARPRVILRALRELFTSARRWQRDYSASLKGTSTPRRAIP
ncbi:MAG TPA: glycosyltransferase [Ktedonobacteraceae bacterium]